VKKVLTIIATVLALGGAFWGLRAYASRGSC
jgi:hypothetical protein